MAMLYVERWWKDWHIPGCSVVKNLLPLQELQETRVWSWVRKIPWRRKWQPISIFLLGYSHQQRSLVGYSSWGCKELDTVELAEHAQSSQWVFLVTLRQHAWRVVSFSGMKNVDLFVVVQSLFVTPWTSAHQASLSFNISWSLLKLMPIKLVIVSNHLIFCCSFLLLPSIFPSIMVFSNELTLHNRWPSYWSFSFSIGSITFQWKYRADFL